MLVLKHGWVWYGLLALAVGCAWVAINFGFEVQIDRSGRPDGAPVHTIETPARRLT